MHTWVHPDWLDILSKYQLDDIEYLWTMDLSLVETPNHERGGYSEVGKFSADDQLGTFYIKRQLNYTYRSRLFPFIRYSLCRREFDSLLWCMKHGIPSPQPLFFLERERNNDRQAVLITKGLDDCVSLSDHRFATLPKKTRRQLLKNLARIVRKLHDYSYVHGSLYPKHVLVAGSWLEGESGDIFLIDLERMKRNYRGQAGKYRDLDTLNRRAELWSYADRLYFLKQYLGSDESDFAYLMAKLGDSYIRMVNKSG